MNNDGDMIGMVMMFFLVTGVVIFVFVVPWIMIALVFVADET